MSVAVRPPVWGCSCGNLRGAVAAEQPRGFAPFPTVQQLLWPTWQTAEELTCIRGSCFCTRLDLAGVSCSGVSGSCAGKGWELLDVPAVLLSRVLRSILCCESSCCSAEPCPAPFLLVQPVPRHLLGSCASTMLRR